MNKEVVPAAAREAALRPAEEFAAPGKRRYGMVYQHTVGWKA